MRKRTQIEKDSTRIDVKTLEVLLDIRELLSKSKKKIKKRKVLE